MPGGVLPQGGQGVQQMAGIILDAYVAVGNRLVAAHKGGLMSRMRRERARGQMCAGRRYGGGGAAAAAAAATAAALRPSLPTPPRSLPSTV